MSYLAGPIKDASLGSAYGAPCGRGGRRGTAGHEAHLAEHLRGARRRPLFLTLVRLPQQQGKIAELHRIMIKDQEYNVIRSKIL